MKLEPGDIVQLTRKAIAYDLDHYNGSMFSKFNFPMRVVKRTGYLVFLQSPDPRYSIVNEGWLEKATARETALFQLK